ncbi:MAG TPA: M28 family peptidase, partial [Vicinamibacterales bacterium]|nr:M28 family peptidase [Vicinamibacterales bacterium]
MNKTFLIAAGLACGITLTAVAQAPDSDLAAMNAKLRAEETNNSKIMWILHEITDVHGPRLTGSPGLREAQDWAVATMKSWGLQNVKLEPWNFNHPGWQNRELEANVLTPFQMLLNVRAVAWTPGTKGMVTGPVLVVEPPVPPAGAGRGGGAGRGFGGGGQGVDLAAIAQAGTLGPPMPPPPAPPTKPVMQADLDAYLAKIKPKVKGAIVFYGPHVDVAENFVPAPLRRPDDQWQAQAGGRGRGGFPQGGRGEAERPEGLTAQEITSQVNKFLVENGALVKVTDSGRSYGTIVQQSNSGYNENPENPNLPTLLMGNEDYGRIYRTVTMDEATVTMRVNIRNEFYPEGKTVYNVTGELPGTDKADEVVMLGGHFDSWNAATGATDNGAGSSDALEAIRLLKAVGAHPRRTIRVALWSGEEEGLYGSIAYVAQHFGSAENPKPEWFKFNGYLNIDSGTGKPRSASVFGPAEAAKMVQEPMSLFKDWGFYHVNPTLGRNTGGTDSTSFNNAGLPGIGYGQDPFDYGTFTHHTSYDTMERIYEPDVREAAVEEALTAYALAMSDQMLPRCSAATMPPPPPEPAGRGAGAGRANVPVTPVREFYGP